MNKTAFGVPVRTRLPLKAGNDIRSVFPSDISIAFGHCTPRLAAGIGNCSQRL
jgi:hypothetical protein